MSHLSEQHSIVSQLDTILKNRYRRFKYLQRNNRMEDAIAVADEFLEWIDPDYFEHINDDDHPVTYFCLDELEQWHDEAMTEELRELEDD